MAFARQLAFKLALALALPAAAGWYAATALFPATDAQRAAAEVAYPVSLLVVAVAAAAALGALVAPLRQVLAAGPDGATVLGRQQAVVVAQRLPGRLAAIVLAGAAAVVAALAVAVVRAGAPSALVLAGLAAGGALGLAAAMLAYSVAAAALAPVVAHLGSIDVPNHGTLRGRVLLVCFALLAMATLLVGSVGYARSRADGERLYVNVAASAQDRAAPLAAAKGPAAAAELVAAATGAPTAFVADGKAVARAGDAPASLAADVPAGSGVEPAPGGWRVRRAVPGGQLVSFLPDRPVRAVQDGFWTDAAALGLLLLVVAAALVWLAARTLTAPIAFLAEASDRMAAGDLTASPPSISRDELGRLAADFRRMARALAAMVQDVQTAARAVQEGVREMGQLGAKVRGGAKEEHERVAAVQAALEGAQSAVGVIGRGVNSMVEHVRSTSAAIGDMASALDEVRKQAGELESRVGSTTGDLERLSEAGRRAQTQVAVLDGLAGNAQGTLSAVSGSLSGLETSAVASQLAAAQAAEMADHAGGVVQEAVSGIESLRSAVGDAKKRVAALGRRSDDIDQILDFIGEVAGRTNLLSLNASIIATQAGEHGKAFAVVADQIRELAAQISSSTKSIGDIIRSLRDDVAGTARLIDRGDELASVGVSHARKSLDALHEIRGATAKGHETAAAIRDAVHAHAQSTRDVSNLVSSVADNSQLLGEAIQVVGRSVSAVAAVSRGVGALAENVSRAVGEQSTAGRRQIEMFDRMNATLADLASALQNHEGSTRHVREALAQLGRTAEGQDASTVELAAVAERLDNRSRALAERVGRFKI